jgi:hypothetical protein
MAEIIFDPTQIEPGERTIVLRVGRAHTAPTVLAELELDLVGPLALSPHAPMDFSGFESRAADALRQAHALASEQGIRRIVAVDPGHMLSIALR